MGRHKPLPNSRIPPPWQSHVSPTTSHVRPSHITPYRLKRVRVQCRTPLMTLRANAKGTCLSQQHAILARKTLSTSVTCLSLCFRIHAAVGQELSSCSRRSLSESPEADRSRRRASTGELTRPNLQPTKKLNSMVFRRHCSRISVRILSKSFQPKKPCRALSSFQFLEDRRTV